jgi:hypothetical protein
VSPIRPLVQLPGYRRHERGESFNRTTSSSDVEAVSHYQCYDGNEGKICQKEVSILSLSSPLSPVLDTENISEKRPSHYLLSVDPVEEACLAALSLAQPGMKILMHPMTVRTNPLNPKFPLKLSWSTKVGRVMSPIASGIG